MDQLPDRLPLVIGVSGHRDLRDDDKHDDVTRLEREVAAVIARLRRDYLGDGQETPIVVLSALAEGADRLVARVALKSGARLIAPLPMPVEEYRRDFEPGLKPGNVTEFDALLKQAIAAPVMPFTEGNSLAAIQSDKAKRDEQYRAVGLFITQHCNVLIALWDGNDQDIAVGGSAEVVKFKRDGIPLTVTGSARASLDASEVGPVVHIVTPRNKEGSPASEVSVRPWGSEIVPPYQSGTLHTIFHTVRTFVAHPFTKITDLAERDIWRNFVALTALTRGFNHEAVRLAATANGPTQTKANLDQLFENSDATESIDRNAAQQRASDLAPRWCSFYAVADTLAQERQARFRLDWKVLFACAFLGVICFDVFSHFLSVRLPLGDYWLAGYVFFFVAAFAVFGIASDRRHQERFLDYRALAEALRVAVFWRLVGIGSPRRDPALAGHLTATDKIPVGSIADAYPIRQPSELAWVKVCLRTLELFDTASALRRRLEQNDHALARCLWVYGQYRYFGRQGIRHNHIAELWEWGSIGLLGLSLLVAVLMLFADADWVTADWLKGPYRHDIIFGVGVLPAIAAFIVGFTEKLAFKAQARQYDRMRMLFERGYHLLPKTIDDTRAPLAQALYAELGSEAMKEHAEWVAIYRQRPIRPPQ
jgi:hypothetical protein